eukprot:11227954-Lingulodinium_polyedra.AAC.1
MRMNGGHVGGRRALERPGKLLDRRADIEACKEVGDSLVVKTQGNNMPPKTEAKAAVRSIRNAPPDWPAER